MVSRLWKVSKTIPKWSNDAKLIFKTIETYVFYIRHLRIFKGYNPPNDGQMIWFCLEHCKTPTVKCSSLLGLPHSSCCSVVNSGNVWMDQWMHGPIWLRNLAAKDQQNWSRYHTIFWHVSIFLVFACICHKRGEEVWAPNSFESLPQWRGWGWTSRDRHGIWPDIQSTLGVQSESCRIGATTWFSAHVSTRTYWCLVAEKYPLVNIQIAMENHHF